MRVFPRPNGLVQRDLASIGRSEVTHLARLPLRFFDRGHLDAKLPKEEDRREDHENTDNRKPPHMHTPFDV